MASLAPFPRLALSSLIRRDPEGGILARFGGRRVVLAHAARVAISEACDMLGLRPGDEVLVPAYNCGSEVDPLLRVGLQPVLYAVRADTVVHPEAVEARITPRTRALYLTHYFGLAQPHAAALRALCDKHGLALMEDCALNLLSRGGQEVGLVGDVAFFSFYKYFPVDAGAALVVNRADLPLPRFGRAPPAGPGRKLLLQGARAALLGAGGVAALRRLKGGKAGPEPASEGAFPDMPGDYYFDPALRGMGLSKLTARALAGYSIARAFEERRRNFRCYQERLAGLPGLRPLISDLPEGACPLNFPVLVEGRDRLARDLAALGAGVTPWWAGYHRGLDFSPFPEACHLKDHVLALPLHQGLRSGQIDATAAALAGLVQGRGRFQAPE